MRRMLRLALTLALVPLIGACGGDDDFDDNVPPATVPAPAADAVRVTDVDVGRSIDADRRVSDEADEFSPTDTIYVSVDTEGTASGSTLSARWTFEDGQVVDESSQTISPTGPAVTEFHISMPDGLPAGRYTVEILLNGQSVESRDFTVR